MMSEVPEPTEVSGGALRAIEERLFARLFAGAPAVRALPHDQAQVAARKALAAARGAKEIEAAMRERGLVRGLGRARGYAPFSYSQGQPKMISIIPYTSPDEKSQYIGAIGLSHGEAANGVIVQVEGTRVTSFITLDFMEGKFSEREFGVADVIRGGMEKSVERKKRGDLEPDISPDQTASIAGDAFRVLLHDEHSMSVHTTEELRALIHNAPIVTTIAELQHMRLRGLSASPDTSCCCCCCCCWGSCSSCSAVATTYLNNEYYELTRN
jgi:hypothetical protein